MNKQYLQKVLWDINEQNIDTLPVEFIIERTLSFGGLFLIVKVMHEYGVDTVKRVFETMKPSSIHSRRYYYLKNFLLA